MNDLQACYDQAMQPYPALKQRVDTLLTAVSPDEGRLLRWLYAHMPLSDKISYPPEVYLDFVKTSLYARAHTPWGADIPDPIFLNNVLFYRVNTENIEPYRQSFFDQLFPLIQGKSMTEAAIFINYWCFSKATYRTTDDRTASPLTVVRMTAGRCGEESTLTVSALRSVGIPARQCYVPRWAHCDDNHAWAEVWTEGRWHYMGACEPEPVLDRGWFTAAASKAMLVHSRIFSNETDEPIIEQTPAFCTLNHTSTYAKTKQITVRVHRDQVPLPGISVRFELLNYGEFYPITTQITDLQGTVTLATGLGDLFLHIHDGTRYLTQKLDVRTTDTFSADFGSAVTHQTGTCELDMNPPGEQVEHADISSVQKELYDRLYQQAEQTRKACQRTFFTLSQAEERCKVYGRNGAVLAEYLVKSGGNSPQLLDFYEAADFTVIQKQELLSTLRDKDLGDCTSEMLRDALTAALPFRDRLDPEVYRLWILSPRIADELLVPARQWIRDFFAEKSLHFTDATQVWQYIREHIALHDDRDYITIFADVRGVLTCEQATRRSADLLFVAVCRAFGLPAGLDPVTRRKQICPPGSSVPETFADPAAPDPDIQQGTLTLVNESSRALAYSADLTIGRLQNGVYETMRFDFTLTGSHTVTLPAGDLRILLSARQIDGSVLVRCYFTQVPPGGCVTLPVSLRPDQIEDKLKLVPLENLSLTGADQTPVTLFDRITGRTVAAFVRPGEEPSEHLFNELIELHQQYEERSVRVIFLLEDPAGLHNETLQRVLALLRDSEVTICADPDYAQRLHQRMGIGDLRKPLTVAVNGEHRGLFGFSNYNVGTAASLLRIFAAGDQTKSKG